MPREYTSLNASALQARLFELLDLLLAPVDPELIPAQTRKGTRATRKRTARYVSLSAVELRLYRSVLKDIGMLREAEWLEEQERDKLLWRLTSEATYHPERFRDMRVRQARIDELLSALLRPLVNYTVLFPVLHVTPPPRPLAVWDATLTAMTEPRFLPHLAADRGRGFWVGEIDPSTTAVLVLDEEGTSLAGAVERARHRAGRRLHMLRSSLALDLVTHDDALLFSLGEHVFAIREGRPDSFWAGWRRHRLPMRLTIADASQDQLDTLTVQFKRVAACHESVRTAVERTYHWLGQGLARSNATDALRDFTTALEILLIARRGEKPKDVLLPYRMIALADLNHSSMIHPTTIRHAYGRRSDVVHEGVLDAVEEEARRMRLAASACLDWLIAFASESRYAAHEELLAALDTTHGRRVVSDWLAKFQDPWSIQLARRIADL